MFNNNHSLIAMNNIAKYIINNLLRLVYNKTVKLNDKIKKNFEYFFFIFILLLNFHSRFQCFTLY